MRVRRLIRTGLLACTIAAAAACADEANDVPSPPAPTPQTAEQQPDQQQAQADAPTATSTPAQQTETVDPPTPAPARGGVRNAQDRDSSPEPTLPLAPRPYDHDFALSVARHLAEEIGPRTAGGPAEETAAAYLSQTFQDLGYDAPIIPFTATARVPWELQIGGGDLIPALAMDGAPAIPASGPLIRINGLGTLDEIAAVNARGAILAVDRGQLTFGEKARNAEAAGAVGLIVVNDDDMLVFGVIRETISIPVAIIPRSASRQLQTASGRTASLGPVETAAGPDGEVESSNVLARWPGGTCRIFIGAHYDSVPVAPGANDNASGTAVLLALARAYAGSEAAKSLCFAAFGAEELGLLGSSDLVRRMRGNGELADAAAMINLDAIGGGDLPIRLIGDEGFAATAAGLAARLQIDAAPGLLDANIGSDHASFEAEGIPILGFFLPNAPIHLPSDTYANLDADLMRDVARIAHASLACIAAGVGISVEPPLPCESG